MGQFFQQSTQNRGREDVAHYACGRAGSLRAVRHTPNVARSIGRCRHTLMCSALLALVSQTTFAQTGANTVSRPTPADEPETVVVAANKVPENLQDVPSSVWVASDRALARAQVRDFDDLVRVAP